MQRYGAGRDGHLSIDEFMATSGGIVCQEYTGDLFRVFFFFLMQFFSALQ